MSGPIRDLQLTSESIFVENEIISDFHVFPPVIYFEFLECGVK